MSDAIRIYVETTGPGRFRARLGSPDGELLVTSSREPALAAARVLIGKGFDPATVLEMWDAERPFPRLRGVLDVMAGQTVVERDKGNGPVFEAYVSPEKRFSSSVSGSKTAVPASGAISVPSDTNGPVRKGCCRNPDSSGEAGS